LAAQPERVQGDLLVLELRRLPGPAGQHPLPSGAEGQGPLRAHPQRQRPGRGPDRCGHPGELPAGGRLRGGAGGAPALHGRPGADHEGAGVSKAINTATKAALLLGASMTIAAAARAQARSPLRVFISADMEGIAGVVNGAQLSPGEFEYERFRKLMTAEVNAAIEAALAA